VGGGGCWGREARKKERSELLKGCEVLSRSSKRDSTAGLFTLWSVLSLVEEHNGRLCANELDKYWDDEMQPGLLTKNVWTETYMGRHGLL
jgi:hypothetical protein